jgi:hypothetical protein
MVPTYAGRGICADMTMGSSVLCNEPLLWRTGGLMVSESYRVSRSLQTLYSHIESLQTLYSPGRGRSRRSAFTKGFGIV